VLANGLQPLQQAHIVEHGRRPSEVPASTAEILEVEDNDGKRGNATQEIDGVEIATGGCHFRGQKCQAVAQMSHYGRLSALAASRTRCDSDRGTMST
jgi:hypothetical protein